MLPCTLNHIPKGHINLVFEHCQELHHFSPLSLLTLELSFRNELIQAKASWGVPVWETALPCLMEHLWWEIHNKGKKQLEDGSGSPPLNQAQLQPGQHVWAEPELKEQYLDFSCTLFHPVFKQESQDKVYFMWIVSNAQQEATSTGL